MDKPWIKSRIDEQQAEEKGKGKQGALHYGHVRVDFKKIIGEEYTEYIGEDQAVALQKILHRAAVDAEEACDLLIRAAHIDAEAQEEKHEKDLAAIADDDPDKK